MDTAMRDLERIEERSAESRANHYLILWGAGLVALVAVLLAVAANVGSSENLESGQSPDPFAALAMDTQDIKTNKKAPKPNVDPRQLTFPSALATNDPPEVAAALAAAAAEYEHPDPLENAVSLSEITEALPGSVIASPDSEVIARAVIQDPMVSAKKSQNTQTQPKAKRGSEGKFVLQVLSYRTHKEATSFANALQKRGHSAYVVSAIVPERGQHWRVRVGPYSNRQQAATYKKEFEKREGISAFIVHNKAH